jgi:hypothetical protein
MKAEKQCHVPPPPPDIDQNSPEWLEGLNDGHRDGFQAPDMARGMTYAHGWITGRWRREPPSFKRH